MFCNTLLILSIISIIIGVACINFTGAGFGIYFFFGLAFCMLSLVLCIKLSKKDFKYNKFFKVISIIGKILLGAFIASFFIIQMLIFNGGFSDDDVIFDVLIVLGAGSIDDSPSQSFKSRLDVAISYLEDNLDSYVIVTGGFGYEKPFSDAYVAKKYLLENGILSDRILMEEKSTNTFENVFYAKELLPENFDGNVCAVSNDFHLYRARSLLEIHNLTGYAIGCEIPHFKQLNYLYSIREYFSILKHFVFEK